MFGVTYLNKLKEKFNYDEKTMNALSKVIPSIISYYGDDFEDIILSAIFDCEIITCNSHQTISKVLNERKLNKCIGSSSVSDIDLRRAEGVYVPNIKLSYEESSNSYKIDEINRVIVISHTFNLDSLKGLEVLTHALCHLVKSYSEEIVIDENTITVRDGIAFEKRKIIYNDDEIIMDFIEDYGKGLEEGLILYDTDRIVSSIYKDEYKTYDFSSIYTVASLLKDKYNLKKELNDCELTGDISFLKNKYGEEVVDNLCINCDKCVTLENEMYLAFTREDKDKCADSINKILTGDVYDSLISIYEKRKNIKI